MFVIMDQQYLSQFPQDIMSEDGMTVVTAAAYGYHQLGADPNSDMRFLFIDGDIAQFIVDFSGNYTESTVLPQNYQQTCCHEFIYGRTLTKATIVAWQYKYHEENALVRQRIDSGEDTDEYLVYTNFVDSIPSENGYIAEY